MPAPHAPNQQNQAAVLQSLYLVVSKEVGKELISNSLPD